MNIFRVGLQKTEAIRGETANYQPPKESLLPRKPTLKDVARVAQVIECKVRCPACGQKIEFDVSLLGTQIRCPKCDQKIESKL